MMVERQVKTFRIKHRGLMFAGHDSTHSHWTSDPRRALYFANKFAARIELERAGITHPKVPRHVPYDGA